MRGNPGLAAVLSFVFNGLGQLYNGQIIKGLFLIFLSVLSIFIFLLGAILLAFWLWGKNYFVNQLIFSLGLCILGLFFSCLIGIYSIVDAYKKATKDDN